MAKQFGGITGRLTGKLGGVVFSSARTFEGKVVTVREKVPPSNPNTAAQQSQRNKFTTIVDWVQGWSPALYQSDWNRSLGQLPGWQSLQKLGLNNISDALVFQAQTDIPLGNLHFPDTAAVTDGTATGEVALNFSTELGANGTNDDLFVIIIYPVDWSSGGSVFSTTLFKRSDMGSISAIDPGLGAGVALQVVVYYRGVGNAEGLLSTAEFTLVTTGA